jgi:TRAP-type C4-dicarboxylate transport system permease small subunit
MSAEAEIAASAGPLPGFGRVLEWVDWVVAKIVMMSMLVMVAVVAGQVFFRYVLNMSVDWAEEISRLAFVWAVFFAIPLGVKRGAHVGIALLTDHLPLAAQDKLFRAMNVLAMVLMAVVAYEAVILTMDQWDEPMSTLDVSVGLFMLPLAVGAAHSFLHLANGVLVGAPPKQAAATE